MRIISARVSVVEEILDARDEDGFRTAEEDRVVLFFLFTVVVVVVAAGWLVLANKGDRRARFVFLRILKPRTSPNTLPGDNNSNSTTSNENRVIFPL